MLRMKSKSKSSDCFSNGLELCILAACTCVRRLPAASDVTFDVGVSSQNQK